MYLPLSTTHRFLYPLFRNVLVERINMIPDGRIAECVNIPILVDLTVDFFTRELKLSPRKVQSDITKMPSKVKDMFM